jgi:lipoprotein-anchoring transpeptidase ErfK/SrfK
MTRKFLGVVLAAATAFGATLAATNADARWYDASSGTWRDGEPVKRNLTDRKPAAKFKKRIVSIRTNEAPGTIIIHTDEKFLYYVTAPNKAIRYGVGVGREGFGWNGVVNIKRKQEWPAWTPPPEMIARERANGHILPARMEGGPENPLGARAMYLYQGGRDTMYRIHGTNQPWSIGLNLSSGCIRMMNEDVTDLYERASVGTKVIVVGPGEDPNRYFTEMSNPLQMFMNSFARN